MDNKSITMVDDITLVTIQNVPFDIDFLAKMFEDIGKLSIDVDMISLAPTQSSLTSVSFTIDDNKLTNLLNYISTLKNKYEVKPIINSGNCKISVFDRAMEKCPGFAAKIFKAAADKNAEIKLISTSEVEVSILIPFLNSQEVFSSINNTLK